MPFNSLCIYFTLILLRTVDGEQNNAIKGESDEQRQNEQSTPIAHGLSANTVTGAEDSVSTADYDTPVNTVANNEVTEPTKPMRSDLVEKSVAIGVRVASGGLSEMAKLSAKTAKMAAPYIKAASIQTGHALLVGLKQSIRLANEYVATPAYNRWGRRLVGKMARELLRVLDPSWQTSSEREAERTTAQNQQGISSCSNERGNGIRIDEQRQIQKLRERQKQRNEKTAAEGKLKMKMVMEEEESDDEDEDDD
ncbi:hypothetical protein niasHS_002843 [Heterodera schachtii]|uniref:Uncharacterized protein n=1 Tax=Heterodera schachtii TaxID=97005 RepID=A0ABD2K2L9_HETSC